MSKLGELQTRRLGEKEPKREDAVAVKRPSEERKGVGVYAEVSDVSSVRAIWGASDSADDAFMEGVCSTDATSTLLGKHRFFAADCKAHKSGGDLLLLEPPELWFSDLDIDPPVGYIQLH